MTGHRRANAASPDTARIQEELDRLEADCEALRAELERQGVSSRPESPAGGGRRASSAAALYRQVAEILDISADAIISVDDRGLVRRFNTGAERIFGYRSSEIIGRPLDILIPERFRRSHRIHMTAFTQASESSRLMNVRGEILGLRRDGTEFPAEASIARLIAEGRPVHTVILRDITERRDAEAAVRSSEALLKAVLDHLPAAVHLKGLDGGYILVNREYERQFGWSNDDAKGRTIGEMHPGPIAAEIEEHDQEVLKTRHAQAREVLFQRPDGMRTYLAVKSPLFNGSNRPQAILCVETDITERKRVEAALRAQESQLRQSEGQLRQAQRMARIGAFIWDDLDDVCIYCSEELAGLFGMTAASFMAERGTGASFQQAVHPEDRKAFRRVTDEARKNAVPYDVEFRCYDTKGDILYFREIGEPVFDENGRQVRTFGTMQDITDIRRAQEALRQSEQQLRTIADNLPAFIAYTDKDQRLLFANKTAGDWYDSRVVDMIGKTAEEILGESAYAKLKHRFEDVLSGESLRFEELREFPDGKKRYVDAANIPSIDERGQVQGWFTLIQDITERRRGEDALRQSEEQLRTITDNVPAFVAYVDKQLRFRFANRLAEEWYVRPASQIIGRHMRDFMDSESFEAMLPNTEAVLAGDSVRFEMELRFPDGSPRSIDVSYAPHFNEAGEIQGFFSLALDVTERRQAQEALRRTMQSGELLRQIATAANDTSSAEEALSFCLKAFCEFGGWDSGDVFVLADDDSEELAPAGLWWAKDPDRFAALRQATDEIRFAPGEGLPGRVAQTGAPVWIEDITTDPNFPRARNYTAISVRSAFAFPVMVGPSVAAVLEFFAREPRAPDSNSLDVASQAGTILGRLIERHRAERALSQREQQIRLITDNLPVLIAYTGSDRKFRFVNGTTEAWYGRPASDLIGHDLAEFFDPAMFEKARPHIEAALQGETVHFEEVLEYLDGRSRNIEATYLPHLDGSGTVRGFFSLVQDVTERVHREEELRHAQRLEAVGKLTGGVAHEFNNQLAVIIGSVELLRERPEGFDRTLEAISRAAVRGSELTQRLLSFSRQQPLRPEVVDLGVLVDDMSAVLARMIGETVTVKAKMGRKLWPAKVDRGQLENAILNLAINAQHAMPRGGTLTLGARNRRIGKAAAAKHENAVAGDYVLLSVSDTGQGMSKDVLAHAFDPFFTTKGVGEGSGLGLSMVYGFASQTGGFVEIESEPGAGTAVTVFLPRASAAIQAARESPLERAAEQPGGTVLVVEDDPDVRMLTVALLSSLGYSVLAAEDGEQALPLLEGDDAIDMLLSDVVLPGDLSGPAIAEVAIRLRPDLKILFMSGYAEDVIRRGREGGLRSVDADMLSKPFTRAELARKVQATLENTAQPRG